jgi:hypothetical protein
MEYAAALSCFELQRATNRAEHAWELDRLEAIADLCARLSRDPQRSVAALRKSVQGTAWLILQWETLGAVVAKDGCLDEDQRRLMCDLKGIRRELRSSTYLVPAFDDQAGLAALIEDELAELREWAIVASALDDSDRAMTLCGMPLVETKEMAHVRKALTRSTSEFFKARNDLLEYRANGCEEAPKEKVLSEAAISHMVDRSKLGPLRPSVTIEKQEAPKSEPAPEKTEPTTSEPRLPKRVRRVLHRREREQERRAKAAAAKTR